MIIDHFRKAGADKARDRFNGSFIKQAGPGCLVAIETRKDGLLELQVDARSFHGQPRVWCRWDHHLYRFTRVMESEVIAAKEGAQLTKLAAWVGVMWKSRDFSGSISAKDAAKIWDLSEQGARNRFRDLERAELVSISSLRPMTVVLADRGKALISTGTKKL